VSAARKSRHRVPRAHGPWLRAPPAVQSRAHAKLPDLTGGERLSTACVVGRLSAGPHLVHRRGGVLEPDLRAACIARRGAPQLLRHCVGIYSIDHHDHAGSSCPDQYLWIGVLPIVLLPRFWTALSLAAQIYTALGTETSCSRRSAAKRVPCRRSPPVVTQAALSDAAPPGATRLRISRPRGRGGGARSVDGLSRSPGLPPAATARTLGPRSGNRAAWTSGRRG
jgi:hypothetical protein